MLPNEIARIIKCICNFEDQKENVYAFENSKFLIKANCIL